MLIDSARRAEAAAKEMLAYVNDGSASCVEMREALAVCKAFMAAGLAFQAGAARVIAQAERHGDGGAQVLADAAGLSRRDAHSQVKTAEAIGAVPAVRDAVEAGRVSQANAKRLAEAVEKTSASDVGSDRELLAKAESMRPEQFAREAGAGPLTTKLTAESPSTGASGPGVACGSGTAMTAWCICGASSTRSPESASPTGSGPKQANSTTPTRRPPKTALSGAASISAWPTPWTS